MCGQECLRAACENGNIDKVKLLVEYGVDIYAENDQSISSALYGNHFEIVDYLMTKDTERKFDYKYMLNDLGSDSKKAKKYIKNKLIDLKIK